MSSPGSIGDVFNSLLMNIVENPITSLTKANYVGILAWAVVIGMHVDMLRNLLKICL